MSGGVDGDGAWTEPVEKSPVSPATQAWYIAHSERMSHLGEAECTNNSDKEAVPNLGSSGLKNTATESSWKATLPLLKFAR